MRRGGQALHVLMRAVTLIMVMIVQMRGSRALPTSTCLSSFSALSGPCDPYFAVLDPPSAECCNPMGDLLTSDPTCICEVLDAAEANGYTGLNETRLVEMFVQCQLDVPASATYCLPPLPNSTPSISTPPPTSAPPPIATFSPPPTSAPPPIATFSPPPPLVPTVSSPPSPTGPSTTPNPSAPPPPSTQLRPPSTSAPPPPLPSSISRLFGNGGNRLLPHGSVFLLHANFILLNLLGLFLL